MDPDVIEILPPIPTSKSLKQKQVLHEIIDIDMIEDADEVIVLDGKDALFNKSKETLANFQFSPNTANLYPTNEIQSSMSLSNGSHNSNKLNDFMSDLAFDDDDYIVDAYIGDSKYDDAYTFWQSRFDSVDFPPSVEAPVPWLHDSIVSEKKPFAPLNDISPRWCKPKPAKIMIGPKSMNGNGQSQMDPTIQFEPTFSTRDQNIDCSVSSSSLPGQNEALSLQSGVKPYATWLLPESSHCKKKPTYSSSSSLHYRDKHLNGSKFPPGGTYTHKISKKQFGTNSLTSLKSSAQIPAMNFTPGLNSSTPWLDPPKCKKKLYPTSTNLYSSHMDPLRYAPSSDEANIPWVQDIFKRQKNEAVSGSSSNFPQSKFNPDENEIEDFLKNGVFKQFDTVEDHSDHFYSDKGSLVKQPSNNWGKKVQAEWRVLEKDLPDTIFVRIYESRLDLLRAVMIGAEGTPYHDGLFFFDVFFPPNYPNVPPHVHYHSGGLRINPNLYNCGKVCLSLLNTWSGNRNEIWIPRVSNMLQVLVSIQGLILNANPYFNEPGYAHMSGSPDGEKRSHDYNERTFILSLRTMLYTLKRPPKHFESFVVRHFCKRGKDIMVACKAYMDGAQVGCLVKGGVQDLDVSDKGCSKHFRDSVSAYMKLLVKAFTKIDLKGCEKFLSN